MVRAHSSALYRARTYVDFDFQKSGLSENLSEKLLENWLEMMTPSRLPPERGQ